MSPRNRYSRRGLLGLVPIVVASSLADGSASARPRSSSPLVLSDSQFGLFVGPTLEAMLESPEARERMLAQMARYLGREKFTRLGMAMTLDMDGRIGRFPRIMRRVRGSLSACFTRLSRLRA